MAFHAPCCINQSYLIVTIVIMVVLVDFSAFLHAHIFVRSIYYGYNNYTSTLLSQHILMVLLSKITD